MSHSVPEPECAENIGRSSPSQFHAKAGTRRAAIGLAARGGPRHSCQTSAQNCRRSCLSPHRRRFIALAMTMVALAVFSPCGVTAEPAAIDYEEPKLLTGTVYETRSGTNKVLFTFKRTAARSNSMVYVRRDFFYPGGALAAREEVAYEGDRLVSFHLDERQTGARGNATVRREAKNPAKQVLLFDWVIGPENNAKRKTARETLQRDTLVGDMIPYFIAAHWNELARGDAVNFRFIASSRLETVGFKLVKETGVTWRGKAALRLRMEPSSLIIAQIVDPLFFIVEKSGEHRVLEYVGRITPKARDGSKWKDLDARSIYD
jgi:hypothetical protein